jgi:predicted adenylyl cyclase CyaB
MQQYDQFYAVPTGRLKLRRFGDSPGELISYNRANVPEARTSEYALHRTTDAASLDEVLSRALPRLESLAKTRHLLIHRNTRIHLEDVAGLGRFIELETVIQGQSEAEAEREHEDIVSALGLSSAERIAVGYIDLLTQQNPIRS